MSENAFGNIDVVVDAALPERNFISAGEAEVMTVEFGRRLRFTGWLVTAGRTPFAAASVRIGTHDFPCIYGTLRPDIAAFFGNPELDKTGFSATIPTIDLLPGLYPLELRGVTESGGTITIGKPRTLLLADVRPDGDFLTTRPSPKTSIQILRVMPERYVTRGGDFRIEGRLRKATGTREVAAVLHDESVIRGHFLDTESKTVPDPERFVIVVPAANVVGPVLAARIVGLDQSGSATLALAPRPIVDEPPHAMVGVASLATPVTAAAGYTPYRDHTGRINRRFMLVSGYAFDPRTGRPGGGVAVRCTRREHGLRVSVLFWGAYGLPTVFSGLDAPAGAPDRSGFEVSIDRSRLEMGLYDAEVLLASPDRRGFHAPLVIPPLAVDADVSADSETVNEERKARKAYAKFAG